MSIHQKKEPLVEHEIYHAQQDCTLKLPQGCHLHHDPVHETARFLVQNGECALSGNSTQD